MPRRTATLEDVARAAGVSQQTVSRVLNRPEVVSARTREQVIRAMQALHYVPNRSAQLLAGKAAPSIGLITASLTLHAPSQIAAAIKSHASLHQLEVAIAMPAQADFVALQARLDELRAQHIRGVIVSLPLESATAERLAENFRAPPPAAADQRHSGGKRSDGARRAQRAGPAQSQRQPGGIGDRLR